MTRFRLLLICASVITLSAGVSLFTGDDLKRNLLYFYAYLLIIGQFYIKRFISWQVISFFLLFLCMEELAVGLFRSTTQCVEVPHGIVLDNPNPSSAILLMGSVWLIVNRSLYAIPLLAFLPFIGSRATILAGIPIISALGVTQTKTVTRVLVGALGLGILIYASVNTICEPENVVTARFERVTSILTLSNLTDHTVEAKERIRAPFNIIPKGELLSDESMPMHNVPFRYAYTYGIASMIAWFMAMGTCLTYRIGWKSWWLVLTIFALSWLDYYFIEPYFLLPFTWMIFIKHLDKEKTLNQEGL